MFNEILHFIKNLPNEDAKFIIADELLKKISTTNKEITTTILLSACNNLKQMQIFVYFIEGCLNIYSGFDGNMPCLTDFDLNTFF